MTIAYLGLGSNLGDRRANLKTAADDIDWDIAAVMERSGVYETEPVGGPRHQPKFLNQVIMIDTFLGPRELLTKLQELEAEMGRDRETEERWGPRVIDIDILLYGDEMFIEPGLAIPHPRMHERAFVLLPLRELAPKAMIHERGTVEECLERLKKSDIESIKRFVE